MWQQLPSSQAEISRRNGCLYQIFQDICKVVMFPMWERIFFYQLSSVMKLETHLWVISFFLFCFCFCFPGLVIRDCLSSLLSPASFLLQGSSCWINDKLIPVITLSTHFTKQIVGLTTHLFRLFLIFRQCAHISLLIRSPFSTDRVSSILVQHWNSRVCRYKGRSNQTFHRPFLESQYSTGSGPI